MAVCVCLQALNSGVSVFVLVCVYFFVLKAELFCYVWAQFPIEGTVGFSSKMGLGKVSQRK